MNSHATLPAAAYVRQADASYLAGELTRGPWDPGQQHAGPPIALACRAIEAAASELGLTHLGRLTANLLRPVPIGELTVRVSPDYAGRNAAHLAATLSSGGKDLVRLTALAQREAELELPAALEGHPLPLAPRSPAESPTERMPFGRECLGYADLVETRVASGTFFRGPCAAWFRLRRPLLEGEAPSGYQRVAVAADSGNGISAVLDISRHVFVNADLTINLLRRPLNEWICVDARTALSSNGCGLVSSRLFDTTGLIGHATQSLAVRPRA